jgi:hypothetical protein
MPDLIADFPGYYEGYQLDQRRPAQMRLRVLRELEAAIAPRTFDEPLPDPSTDPRSDVDLLSRTRAT